MRIQAGVPGIGVKLALCELEHLLETVKPECPAVNCTDYDLQLEFSQLRRTVKWMQIRFVQSL